MSYVAVIEGTDTAKDASGCDYEYRIASLTIDVPRPRIETDSGSFGFAQDLQFEFPHIVYGEPFQATLAYGIFSLRHARWSVMGEGSNLLAAEEALLHEARIDVEVFLDIPIEQLSVDALAYRKFLLRIVT